MANAATKAGVREGVRFVSVCQPHAGDFLYAIPSHTAFRIPTWALRIAMQRRLGLAITHAAGADRGTTGAVLDVLGDVAQNTGREGHAGRHAALLQQLVRCARSVWGQRVTYEPRDNWSYNQEHRPDVTTHGVMPSGCSHTGDLKLFSPVPGDASKTDRRGAFVAFGNTLPRARSVVVGLKERNPEGGRFSPYTGEGHVEEHLGDYDQAIREGFHVDTLLFEVFGGFGPDVVRWLGQLAAEVGNALSSSQQDDSSWSAQSWKSFHCQKLAVQLQIGVAHEVASELGISAVAGSDPRDYAP